MCEHVSMGHELQENGEVGARVVEILNLSLGKSPMSLRKLSEKSGVKLTRLGDVLRRGKVITVGELDVIADALGLIGWRVMREAEMALSIVSDAAASLDPNDYEAAANEGEDVEAEQEGMAES